MRSAILATRANRDTGTVWLARLVAFAGPPEAPRPDPGRIHPDPADKSTTVHIQSLGQSLSPRIYLSVIHQRASILAPALICIHRSIRSPGMLVRSSRERIDSREGCTVALNRSSSAVGRASFHPPRRSHDVLSGSRHSPDLSRIQFQSERLGHQ